MFFHKKSLFGSYILIFYRGVLSFGKQLRTLIFLNISNLFQMRSFYDFSICGLFSRLLVAVVVIFQVFFIFARSSHFFYFPQHWQMFKKHFFHAFVSGENCKEFFCSFFFLLFSIFVAEIFMDEIIC